MAEKEGFDRAIFPNSFIFSVSVNLASRSTLQKLSRCLGLFRFVSVCFGVRWAPFGHQLDTYLQTSNT